MTINSTSSILKDGKLKPGVYKIQNLQYQHYVDIQEHSRQLWGYPARDLEEGRGLWEIKNLGAGYMIQRVEPEKPDQFCNPMEGLDNRTPIFVSPYPAAWKAEVVDEDKHRGFEYIRFHWGNKKSVWDMESSARKVHFWEDVGGSNQIWKLIPVKIEGTPAPPRPLSETLGSGSLPSYDEDATGQSSTRAQHSEYREHDDFGTIVTEITITRKKYRVQDA